MILGLLLILIGLLIAMFPQLLIVAVSAVCICSGVMTLVMRVGYDKGPDIVARTYWW